MQMNTTRKILLNMTHCSMLFTDYSKKIVFEITAHRNLGSADWRQRLMRQRCRVDRSEVKEENSLSLCSFHQLDPPEMMHRSVRRDYIYQSLYH